MHSFLTATTDGSKWSASKPWLLYSQWKVPTTYATMALKNKIPSQAETPSLALEWQKP